MAKNGRFQYDRKHVDDVKPELGVVVSLHPGKKIDGLGMQREFGKLKPGDRFQFMKTASTPKGESPIFQKTEAGRMDENDSFSDLFNYWDPATGFKGWLSFVLPVIPID